MKKILLLILFILFLPISQAMGEEINPQEVGYLEAEVSFVSFVNSSGKVNELNHSVYIIPEHYTNLNVTGGNFSVTTDVYGNKELKFFWKNFEPHAYTVRMKVKNFVKFNGPKKLKFPYNPPKETFEYLSETKHVIITDDIREKAVTITQGVDNSFEAIERISTWVHSNLDYDLLYSGKILSSNKVYKIRKGTCDEFTNLFIAMCRAVGIPARYVAGLTYSKDGWGYHAWAEVYLDKWVPVDPTWNEIGWIDATHIEFGKFPDGENVKVIASYVSAQKVDIQITQPQPSVKIIASGPMPKIFSTDFNTYPSVIGIGESSVLTIKTVTTANGCLATSLKTVPRVDSSGSPIVSVSGEKTISVCPGEEKESHFIITSNKSLDRRYKYYSLADIYTFLGERKTIDLEIDPRETDYSNIDIWLSTQTGEVGDKIKFSILTDSRYKVYSNLPVSGNELIARAPGSYYIIAATEKGQVVRKDIEVRKNLTFRIKNIKKPELVKCGEKFNVSFTIENLGENYFEIETNQSDELRYVPVQYIKTEDKEIGVVLKTELKEKCSGTDQFINIRVNDQKIFEKIETEKPFDVREYVFNIFEYIMNNLSKLLDFI